MIGLGDLLESLDSGQKVELELTNGSKFVLYDFEMVDESIYDRADLVVATIDEVLISEFQYRVGAYIELAIGDIVLVDELLPKRRIFESS